VPDGNTTTAGNYSIALLSDIFITPNATSITFTSSITSELNDLVVINNTQVLNCSGARGHEGYANTQKEITVFPNPSNGIINMNIILDKDCQISYNVINALGQVVISEDFGYTSFINKQLNIEEKGVYFIQLNIDNEISTKKLIIKY
jgi:hypothetical protein